VKVKRIQQTRCKNCGRSVPNYDVVSYGSETGGFRELCGKCFNTEVAASDGLDGFEHADLAPVELTDCNGRVHVFHFRMRLFGPGVALDAFELRDGLPAGYQFQIIGDPEDDPLKLLARLIERMRRALSVKHIEQSDLGLQIAGQVVRGGIGWDEAAEDRVPLITIDGRDISWSEFGRMLMTFEGWHFKLEIRDKSEEV
jgi:hypothetical protein